MCLAASDDKFQAYPGFRYRDESGNSWATFGRSLSWPKPEWWSKRRPGALELNNFVFRGYQYPPVIMLAPHKNPEPAVFQGNYKGFALQTYQAGKLVDDATDVYNNLQRNGFNVFPVAVNEVETPEQVRAAAALPVQTYMRWWELADVLAALSGNVAMHQGAYVWDWSAFVSSGPLIRDLRVFNFGTADLAVPNNDRYRVRLDRSPSPEAPLPGAVPRAPSSALADRLTTATRGALATTSRTHSADRREVTGGLPWQATMMSSPPGRTYCRQWPRQTGSWPARRCRTIPPPA